MGADAEGIFKSKNNLAFLIFLILILLILAFGFFGGLA